MLPEERLTACIAVSFILVYLSSFLVFAFRLPVASYGSILAICAAVSAWAWRDLVALLKSPEVKRLLLGLGLLAVWVVALLTLIRNYSGDNWYGDWLEHYQRSLYFLDHPDSPAALQGGYALAARPPLMNVVCACFMAVAGRDYPVYQLLAALLSLLIYLPVCLLARRFSAGGRFHTWFVAAFLMLNPLVVQNVTYGWTKMLAAFYVLTGIHFYVQGWREKRSPSMFLAIACLSAGIVTHYSAGPYALFLAGHLLLVVLPSRKPDWRSLSAAVVASLVVLGSWFAYSVSAFGKGTVTSTTSYFEAAGFTAVQNLSKIAGNIFDTLVPSLLRGVEVQGFGPRLFWGPLRDAAFRLYQFNLVFGLGCLGAILLVLGLLGARKRTPVNDRAERTFWLLLAVCCLVVGIAVQGERYTLGLVHITLQPLVLIGLAFLAGRFGEWSAGLKWLAWTGLLLDALFGIAIHFWFQSLTFVEPSPAGWGITSRDLLVGSVRANWRLKQDHGLTYLGDLVWPYAGIFAGVALVMGAGILVLLAREAGSVRTAVKAEVVPTGGGSRRRRRRKLHR